MPQKLTAGTIRKGATMDFTKTILREKTFKFSEISGNAEDTGEITLIHSESCPAFVNDRVKILNDEKLTQEKRQDKIIESAIKNLAKSWSGLTYKERPVKCNDKNRKELAKNTAFVGLVFGIAFNQKFFADDIELDVDFEEVEKN